MTEIIFDANNCELWNKAKVLASERGFTRSKTCPMARVCVGVRCSYIKPEETIDGKLQKLRDELSEIQSAGYEGVKDMELGV